MFQLIFWHIKYVILLEIFVFWLVQGKTPILIWFPMLNWLGLISGWATILVPCAVMPGGVRLTLYSTFTPLSCAIMRGLSLNRSKPDSSVSPRVLRFSSLSKAWLPVQNIWSGCFLSIWAAPFPSKPPWLPVRVVRRRYYYYYYHLLFKRDKRFSHKLQTRLPMTW